MVITKKNGQLEYLTAQEIKTPHCFTTRLGGVSSGHLASLNIGFSRGDDPENVMENFRRLGSALGFSTDNLVLSRQTHSDIVHKVTQADRGAGVTAPSLDECDALITDVPGLALVVSTADCTPILLWDSVTGAVGAAHAGWRGTASAIAAKTVEAMKREYGSRPEDIHAAIGPNIGLCHFETDADVPEAMLSAFGPEMHAFIRQDGAKYHLDLKGINAWILQRAGMKTIEISTECTFCQCDRFWSHRATKGIRGSQGAIILCREGQQ